MIFDVLEHDGVSLLNWPYRQRRELLEELSLSGSHWNTAMAFDEGQRLFDAVCEIGLEGVVAKKLSQRYRPGERLWVKVKNRDYWRYPLERESAIQASRRAGDDLAGSLSKSMARPEQEAGLADPRAVAILHLCRTF